MSLKKGRISMALKQSARVLVCNIGWMDRYQGLSSGDKITGGGSYIDQKGYGSEIHNFSSHRGRVYGGVFPVPHETINVQKLNGSTSEEKANGVTVIWCAKRPDVGGSYVVGWYKNASVFAEYQDAPAGSDRPFPGKKQACGFYVSAQAKDAVCLDKDERLLRVPRGSGGIGNSNIWFPELTSIGRHFLKHALRLVENGHLISPKRKLKQSRSGGRQSDVEKRQRIERLAMDAVDKWYRRQGYDVIRVAAQNLGWDIEAVLKSGSKKAILRIEVKGLSGSQVSVELTPNEFTKMQLHADTYKLCVVTNAEHPKRQKLFRFGFSNDSGKWYDQNGTVLNVVRLTGAKCTV